MATTVLPHGRWLGNFAEPGCQLAAASPLPEPWGSLTRQCAYAGLSAGGRVGPCPSLVCTMVGSVRSGAWSSSRVVWRSPWRRAASGPCGRMGRECGLGVRVVSCHNGPRAHNQKLLQKARKPVGPHVQPAFREAGWDSGSRIPICLGATCPRSGPWGRGLRRSFEKGWRPPGTVLRDVYPAPGRGQRVSSGVCRDCPPSPSVFVPPGGVGGGREAIKTWPPAFHYHLLE